MTGCEILRLNKGKESQGRTHRLTELGHVAVVMASEDTFSVSLNSSGVFASLCVQRGLGLIS